MRLSRGLGRQLNLPPTRCAPSSFVWARARVPSVHASGGASLVWHVVRRACGRGAPFVALLCNRLRFAGARPLRTAGVREGQHGGTALLRLPDSRRG